MFSTQSYVIAWIFDRARFGFSKGKITDIYDVTEYISSSMSLSMTKI